jgi:hypothetical protein
VTYPKEYCAEGAALKMRESDSRAIMQQARRSAEFWHASLKRHAGKHLEHRAACPTCAGKPKTRPATREEIAALLRELRA